MRQEIRLYCCNLTNNSTSLKFNNVRDSKNINY